MNNSQHGGTNKDDIDTYETKYNIPEYNNPMSTNAEKEIYNAKHKKHSVAEKPPTVSFQYYQPQNPKKLNNKGEQYPHPGVFAPSFVPNPFDPRMYAYYMQYMSQNPQPVAPIYNDVNININGISGSHIKAAAIFEDYLPIKNVQSSFRTVEERRNIYEAIRSNLFNNGDGNNMPIENNTHNLLSYLKFMDLNPYNASVYTNNPYKGLAFGFLLFRSCYPLKHRAQNSSTICAPNSTGINVRIYRLTEGSFQVHKHDIARIHDYDEWRDVSFYNFVKEHIIKTKISPNFPFLYGYYITYNSNINFDELQKIQRVTTNQQAVPQRIPPHLVARGVPQPAQPRIQQIPLPTTLHVPTTRTFRISRHVGIPTISAPNQAQPIVQTRTIDLNKYTGKVLVCLTEACNYNILGWAKKVYKKIGNISSMTNTGYHPKHVWLSVLFQMMTALYVLQLKSVIINNFKIDRNVFIKDINPGGNVTNFWKYRIDGIDYYIPNYGYLVIIDSNFKDFEYPYSDTYPNQDPHTIEGYIIENCRLLQDECNNRVFEMFKHAVDPSNFGSNFVNDNGIKPPEEVIQLLSAIYNYATSNHTNNIGIIIRKFMTMFINNRVGTPLNDKELNNIKRGAIRDFRKGQIVVALDGVEKFVVLVNQANGTSTIITRDKLDLETANFIEKNVPTVTLHEYSITTPIIQRYKHDSEFNDEKLLETYIIE